MHKPFRARWYLGIAVAVELILAVYLIETARWGTLRKEVSLYLGLGTGSLIALGVLVPVICRCRGVRRKCAVGLMVFPLVLLGVIGLAVVRS